MVKNNKLFKVLLIILVAISIVVSFSGIVNADVSIDTFSGSIKANKPDGIEDTTITNPTQSILYVIQAVGIAAGVIIIAYMGVKYITSSPEGKAELKKQAYVYILGAAFLMLAPTIASAVFNLLKQ
jgi:hypothetical protein